MNLLSRVVWSEGMYLGPQHFQAQNRYFEDSLRFSTSTLQFEPYGLIGYSTDEDALQNGTVALLHARGLFGDGLAFQMPECDGLPEPRFIGSLFPPTRDAMDVLLAIPAPHRLQTRTSNGAARFVTQTQTVPDENTGHNERPVDVGRKNIQLLLDTEPQEGYETIRIARILRDDSGNYTYDPRFIPPCVQISASEPLMLEVRQLIEILEEKSTRLAASSTGRSGDFAPRDLANFWLLHAVNSALAGLRHLWMTKRSHPEELFLELLRLGGALCTFSLHSHPRELPVYNHQMLDACFGALFDHIRRHLEVVIPTTCIPIPLNQTSQYFWSGVITDTRCLGRSRWILGIQANVGEADLITRAPHLVKVCSSKFVGELVKRALAGLTLTHLPAPPPALPAKAEAQYFSITKAGRYWDHIVETRGIGVYAPGELPQPELELFAVMDS